MTVAEELLRRSTEPGYQHPGESATTGKGLGEGCGSVSGKIPREGGSAQESEANEV